MNVISKDKAKGKVHGTMKKLRKHKRLVAEKDNAIRTENKRLNAENRKLRVEMNEKASKVKEVIILDFVKGMLVVEIEGEREKRALLYDKKVITLKNFKESLPSFRVKLYGDEYKLSSLGNYEEMKDKLITKLEFEEIFE